jgi:hypothetical protein
MVGMRHACAHGNGSKSKTDVACVDDEKLHNLLFATEIGRF